MRWFRSNNTSNDTIRQGSSGASSATQVVAAPGVPVQDVEKTEELEDGKVPFLTMRTFVMAVSTWIYVKSCMGQWTNA
jgi:hypothetical protein